MPPPPLPTDAMMQQLLSQRVTATNQAAQAQTADLQQLNQTIMYASLLLQNLKTGHYSPTNTELAFLMQNGIPYSATSVSTTVAKLQTLINTLTSTSMTDMMQLEIQTRWAAIKTAPGMVKTY